ncbi:putative ABC transport system permease protein [Povalibacter uvarum]|uniref:Putative ABC transport system permease protein n=1 Tax=Povalibacter uvarum TaxID=732238 RepID=A0A841HRQ4_9GAMM|nr:FtsX-like permease family protein [Povalibacter uvarum]MBB6096031.1 putative ABC transport system permease protein [Povalibacter uvarum]
MEFRPILSAMLRNKTGVFLVGLQIALTLAVVANAVFIIMQRVEKIGRPPGIDSANLIFAQSYGFGPNYDHRDTVRRDVDMLRAIPGVVAVTALNGIPMSGGGRQSGYTIEPPTPQPNPTTSNIYFVDEHGVDALGVKLIEGRAFTEAEIQYNENPTNSDFAPSVIITQAVAQQMFGDGPALGKPIYDNLGQSAIVIGVIENMLGAWVGFDQPSNVMLQPRLSNGPTIRYAIRTEPGRRDQLVPEVEKKLAESNLNRAVTWVRPHTYWVERSYRADSRMVAFLSVIVSLMVLVTALGIVGLASFHVSVRTKQIGTRRAVGARRIDIIRYFMIENWLLTTGGVALGLVLAFAFGHWLSSTYSLPRLEPLYPVAGVVLLWILGQIAVFVPARRAAAIPPAIATRTV